VSEKNDEDLSRVDGECQPEQSLTAASAPDDSFAVRLTERLREAIGNAVLGGVRSYVDAYPHANGIGVHSLTKRITGQLWGVLKTHPDVRARRGKFPDELVAALDACRAECSEKARIISVLRMESAKADPAVDPVGELAKRDPSTRDESSSSVSGVRPPQETR
jgi:hypothetical protein